jgi:hypothetical protein
MKAKIALSLFSIIIALLICELVFRLQSATELSNLFEYSSKDFKPKEDWIPNKVVRSDRSLGFELVPNSQLSDTEKINSLGLKDKERRIEKDKDTFRIIVLGDSITFHGYYVDYLEVLLNEKRPVAKRFEVWNCGVPAYGVFQEKEYLFRRGLKFNPDLVIVGFCLNDFGATPFIVREKDKWMGYFPDKEVSTRINPFLLRHSYLYRFILSRTVLEKKRFQGTDQLQTGYSVFKDMKEGLSAKGVPLLVVIFPYLKDYPVSYDDNEKKAFSDVLAICEKLKIDHLSLFPYYEASKPWTNLWMYQNDYVHPNLHGHRIASAVIFNYLVKNYFSHN